MSIETKCNKEDVVTQVRVESMKRLADALDKQTREILKGKNK